MASPTSGSSNSTLANGLVHAPVDSYGPQITIVSWLQVGLSAVFLGLRLLCKYMKHRGLWWDDHVLVAAWIALVCEASINTASVSVGFGSHIYAIPPANLGELGLLGQFSATAAIFAAVWSKTSFGMTLLRITKGGLRAAVWFLIVTMNLAMGVSVLVTWIQCDPPQRFWDRTVPGECWDPKVNAYYGVASGVYSGLCDIILALLPWTVIWGLQMKKQEKIGIAVAMSMGIFAGVSAFIKSYYIPLLLEGDFTYLGYQLVTWGTAEAGITIMAASIPVLRVLVREVKTATRRRYGYDTTTTTKAYHPGKTLQQQSVSRTSSGSDDDGRKEASSIVTVVKSDQNLGRLALEKRFSSEKGYAGDRTNSVVLGAGRILQTQEITIQYEEREDAHRSDGDAGRFV